MFRLLEVEDIQLLREDESKKRWRKLSVSQPVKPSINQSEAALNLIRVFKSDRLRSIADSLSIEWIHRSCDVADLQTILIIFNIFIPLSLSE